MAATRDSDGIASQVTVVPVQGCHGLCVVSLTVSVVVFGTTPEAANSAAARPLAEQAIRAAEELRRQAPRGSEGAAA